ncbi:MAG: translation initiation factor IF-2 [Candidatus Paceibacterota bacterium]
MTTSTTTTRPPIIAVMGHIDHGKSTLLDTIRRTKVVESEAGGITQHVSAYEVASPGADGTERRMTFLDTPGHEAFSGVRARGAEVADIAILIVAADDGVQPQTKEALDAIRAASIPFIVAINKVDKNNADIERTKQSLLEYEIYIEQFGGDVPVVEISALEGTGIDDLLDMISLVSEMQELIADPTAPATGIVLESIRDPQRGIAATLIVTNGTLERGVFVVAGSTYAPVRIMENFLGEGIDSASLSQPVNIVGWSDMPKAGAPWETVINKKAAERSIEENASGATASGAASNASDTASEQEVIPIILKADTTGGIEGLTHELKKLENERISLQIVHSGIGPINENDVMLASTNNKAIIVGFNIEVSGSAKTTAQRDEIEMGAFDIIYDAIDWLTEAVKRRTPMIEEKETTGKAKILRRFSQSKHKQVLGGRVEEGVLKVGEKISVYRREAEIAKGTIKNLQQQKEDVSKVEEGMEFGTEIEARIEIQPGDFIEAFDIVKK